MATTVAAPPKGTSAPPKSSKPMTAWTTDSWTTLLIDVLNVHLKATNQKLIPITQNNINNIERMMTSEVAGQQGGFLRDNNPLNVGTYPGTPGLYGGHVVNKFGTQLNVFNTPLAGAQGTAQYLQKYGTNLIAALQQNAPTAMFAGASPWWHVSSTPLKETASGAVGPLGPYGGTPAPVKPGKVNLKIEDQILASANAGDNHWNATLAKEYLALSPADRLATYDAAQNAIAKSGNLSLIQQLEAAAGGVGSGVKKTATAAASDATAVTNFLSKLSDLAFWKRIGIGALGAALLLGGTAIFLSTTKPVQAAEGAAAGLL